jgi:hypothetical protein
MKPMVNFAIGAAITITMVFLGIRAEKWYSAKYDIKPVPAPEKK